MRQKFRKIVQMKVELRAYKERLDGYKHVTRNESKFYNLKLEAYIHALEDLHAIVFEDVLIQLMCETKET